MEATASWVASSPPGGRPTGPGGNLGQVLCAQYRAARAASNFASSSLLKSPALVIMTATASQCRFSIVKDIRRATRRQFSAEEKIRIVLEGLRGEESIAELCRREGIVQNLYYRWSKDFLEAGKKRLAGDTARAATSDEVKDLRREASALKEVVAELTLENRLLKKSVIGDGEEAE